MKKPLIVIVLFFAFVSAHAQAPHGLEKIIVERYYVSDSTDAAKSKDRLPVGSVTYRIFVDMLPAYRLQAVYGVPGHELLIATSTSFFNCEDKGSEIANNIPSALLQNNTLQLDSWISVGAAAENRYAILKSDDTSKAIINTDGVLQNTDPAAGIPLTVRDGMFPSSVVSVVTLFGIDTALHSVFGKRNLHVTGQSFSTENGSWASFGGAIGVHPMNRVLIAQVTTDGELSFKLNLQIGTPDGKTENYVAENPSGNEILFSDLICPQVNKTLYKDQKK